MSPPAIWPPHSSEQIFEAGIRTHCHAYLNEETSGSQQISQMSAGDGDQCGGRGGRREEEGHPHYQPQRCQLEPTYTFIAENTV